MLAKARRDGRTLLVYGFAVVVALIGAVLTVRGLLPDVVVAFSQSLNMPYRPYREIHFPITLALVVGAYVTLSWRQQPRPIRTVLALILLDLAGIELSRDVVTLRMAPLHVSLDGVEGTYVRLATLGLLATAGYASFLIIRQRWIHLLPIAIAVVVGAGRLLVGLDAIGVGAVGAGAAAGVAAQRIRVAAPLWARSERIAVTAIVAIAFAVRMAFAWRVWAAHGLDFPRASDDGVSYDAFAWLIASGLGYLVDTSHLFYNFYVVALSGIYALTGHSFLIVGAIQSALAAGMALVTYWLGRTLAGPGAGVLAAVAVTVNSNLLQLAAVIGTEALAVPLIVAAVALLWACIREGSGESWRPWLAGAAGLLFGIAAITRDAVQALPALLLVWLIWALARRVGLGRTVAAASALFVLGVALAYVPFNLYRDRFAYTQQELGPIVFSLGHPQLASMGVGPSAGIGGSLAIVAARPVDVIGAFVSESVLKTDRLLFASGFGTFDLAFLEQQSAFAKTAEVYFLAIMAIGTYVLVVGPGIALEGRMLLLALPAYGLLTHVVLFHANAGLRYRAPYDAALAVIFAVGAMYLVERVRDTLRRSTSTGL